MSTSVTVYNIAKQEYFYLDRDYWLSAPKCELLSAHEMRKYAFEDARRAENGVKAWLEGLMGWLEQDGVYVAIPDTDWRFTYFTTYRPSEKNL